MRPKKTTASDRKWWSAAWLDAARKGGLKTRLQRGKILAREGRVQEVQIEGGLLQGEIRMSPQIKYHPTLQLEIVSEVKKEKILSEMSEKPHAYAHLLNGQLDPEWQDIFASAGAPLLPEQLSDLVLDCSCGDPQHLCTHLAALFQIIADEFERDPAALLTFRGIPKESWQKDTLISNVTTKTLDEIFNPQEFWSGGKIPALPTNQNDPLILLKNLGPFPLWQGKGKGPIDGLKSFYLASADLAEEDLNDKN